MEMYIVLATFVLFCVMILSGKVKIPTAAMIIPVILELTQVLTFDEAWSGLLNSSVIMMASMFIIGAALGKTSIISRLSKSIIKPNSKDWQIMLGLSIPVCLLGCFVNATATIAIMLPIVVQVCAEQKKPTSKFLFPVALMSSIWAGFIPTGGNAGAYIANNTIIENLGGVGTYTFFTNMISKIPFVVLGTIVVIFLYPKFTPSNGQPPVLADVAPQVSSGKAKTSALTPEKEKLTIVLFTLTLIGVVACAILGYSTWYPSTAGAALMVLTGIMSEKEAITAIGNPVIYITIGTLPLSVALKKTGADAAIASGFQSVAGDLPPFVTMVLLFILASTITQFMSNTAVNQAFKTIAALIAVQMGYSPVAAMLAAERGSATSFLTPLATPPLTMVYDEGKYTLKQYFLCGLPLTIIAFLTYVFWVPFIFRV